MTAGKGRRGGGGGGWARVKFACVLPLGGPQTVSGLDSNVRASDQGHAVAQARLVEFFGVRKSIALPSG